MRIVTGLALAAGLLGLAAGPAAQTPEERAAARELV
jgi:hypothetical protein